MSWQLIENRVLKSFDILLGISPATLSTDFRKRIRGILQEKYPKGLDRSALRELVEGNLGSNPIVPSTARKVSSVSCWLANPMSKRDGHVASGRWLRSEP